jgi:hypothetical protein
MRGLRLVELARPRIIRILWQLILSLSHVRVQGSVVLLLIVFIVITILPRISIAASWRRGWPLTGGRRISTILTLIVLFAIVRAISMAPRDRAHIATLGGTSHEGRDQRFRGIHRPDNWNIRLQAKRHTSQLVCERGKASAFAPFALGASNKHLPFRQGIVNGKLHHDGVAITTGGLIHRRVILRRGDGTFILGHSGNAGCRRSGSFITTCLYRRMWCAMLSLDKNSRALQLHDSIGHRCCRMWTSSSLRHSKQLPRAAIMASANSVATPSLIAAATLSVVMKLAPFNASLSAVEAVSTCINGLMGLIN